MTGIAEKTLETIAKDIFDKVWRGGADTAIAEVEEAASLYHPGVILKLLEGHYVCYTQESAGITYGPGEGPSGETMTFGVTLNHNGIAFARYVAEGRGDQAAPLLKAYLSEADKLTEEQYGDYFELFGLHAKAVQTVAEAAHRTVSAGNHGRLNRLASARKPRIVGRAPGL